jgi:hypothetical protein
MSVLETFPRERVQSLHPQAWAHPALANLSLHVEQRWPDLPTPLILEWTETPLLAVDDSGVPWLVGSAEQDPLRDSRGRTVLPRRQRDQLKQIAALGVPFQRLAIAHELDHEGPVQDLLPALREGPLTCTDEVARALVGEIPLHPGVLRVVCALDSAVRVTISAIPAAVTTILDPIIFGVIAPTPPTPPQHGELCLWYPLAAWRW